MVALIASVRGERAVAPPTRNDIGGEPNKLTGTLVATGIVILLTTPLQALGEEYAFRGYLMQAFGSLTHGIAGLGITAVGRGSPPGRTVITSVLFALAHGAQNFPLFFDRFAFGLMAGLIVILVGGLEAGIALHILNNLLAFGVAIFFGDLEGALTVSEVSWWQLPVTIAQNGVFLVLVLLVARRMGLSRRRLRRSPRAPAERRWASAGTPRGARPAAGIDPAPIGGRRRRLCIFDPRFARQQHCVAGRADPMGYGVIGSPTGSGPVSLGSSPSTPASTAIWLSRCANARVSSALEHQQAPVV